MRKYWLKIGFGALLIFCVGFGVVSVARGVKEKIVSNQDIEIPLGPFIGFNLDGTRLGSLRMLTINRTAPKVVSGFNLRVRVNDSAGFARVKDCRLSVNDASTIDERTHFVCLASDSGYVPFGEVRVELRRNEGSQVVVLPLLLPPRAVAGFQRGAADHSAADLADSVAAEVKNRVRVQSRAYSDSVRAEAADQNAAKYKRRADSLRAAAARSKVPAPAVPVPAQPPTP